MHLLNFAFGVYLYPNALISLFPFNLSYIIVYRSYMYISYFYLLLTICLGIYLMPVSQNVQA